MDIKTKYLRLIANTGYTARTPRGVYGQATERDRSLIEIGMEIERAKKNTLSDSGAITSSKKAYSVVKKYFSDISYVEEIFAILLDSRNKVLSVEKVSAMERVASSLLDTKKLLRTILSENAASIILAHNHPSGMTEASSQDVHLTENLASFLESIGVSLIDHLVITEEGFNRI